jgi:hypothetical protein
LEIKTNDYNLFYLDLDAVGPNPWLLEIDDHVYVYVSVDVPCGEGINREM